MESKVIVSSFLKALNEEDFDKARTCLSDGLKFRGVLGSREGGDDYIADMRKMKFKYEILKIFHDGYDVCVPYNINMGGKDIFTGGWYQIQHHTIANIKV